MKNDEFEKALDQIISELVKVRKDKGISHEKLTELSGLSRTAISYIEARKSTPSIISVMKLCKALDVELSELLENTK
ncbi:MAG: helix-turn-helix domain-containing protein [Alphaproteobacteria bacterium]